MLVKNIFKKKKKKNQVFILLYLQEIDPYSLYSTYVYTRGSSWSRSICFMSTYGLRSTSFLLLFSEQVWCCTYSRFKNMNQDWKNVEEIRSRELMVGLMDWHTILKSVVQSVGPLLNLESIGDKFDWELKTYSISWRMKMLIQREIRN